MESRRGPRRWTLGLVAAVLGLTACGSTVQMGRGAGGQSADSGLGLGSGAAATGFPAGVDGEGANAVPSSAGPGSAVSSGPGSSSALGGGPGAALAGRGFTAKEMYVGVAVQDDAQEYGRALGLNVSFGSGREQTAAIVADINRRGGILGRKVVPIFHNASAAQTNSDPNAAQQSACTDWTEDHKVVAVISSVAGINHDNLFACLARHDTPLFFSDGALHAASEIARHPSHLYLPGVTSVDRMVGPLVDRLAPQRYFTGWDSFNGRPGSAPVKIGVLSCQGGPTATASKRYQELVVSSLARRGMRVAATFGATCDLSNIATEANAAVLQFSNAGVTHVMPGNLFFAEAAEQQHYRPRYAITTWDAPHLLVTSVPSAQLAGALGVGYVPANDVDAAHDPGDVSAAAGRCRKIMENAGQDTSARLTFYAMAIRCDTLSLLEQAASRAGGFATPAIRSGVESLGATFLSAITFRSRFAPGRHDGAAAVRDLGFDGGCSCFTYRGTLTST